MRDPRLAEIGFLSALERAPVSLGVGSAFNGEWYGLGAEAVRSMLFDMLAQQLVNGPATILAGELTEFRNPIRSAEILAEHHCENLLAGTQVEYRITHKGRIRLWRLRDELRTDRGREPFGILFDRRAWDRELAVQLYFATEEKPFSVLSFDLDKFKQVNDRLGHPTGDDFLKRYMQVVQDIVADRGDAYRLGGDEVTASLAATTLEEAKVIAERIRAAIESEFKDEKVPATVSIGVGTFVGPVESADATSFVDRRLYEAKDAGRNCVRADAYVAPAPPSAPGT
jgi:diguanylate cyclase (GGDEF)-like protein